MKRGKIDKKKAYAIFDLDGTLAEIGERQIYAVAGEWDEFNSRCSHDKPRLGILAMCNAWATHPGNGVIILTGRSDKWIEKTLYWLELWQVKYDYLIMRDEGDHMPDFEMKKKALKGLIEEEVKIIFVVEDRDACVNMFREEGLICLKAGESVY
jgi:hypothetical protein